MRAPPNLVLLLGLFAGPAASALPAQTLDLPPAGRAVRVGVALSGGSAKGFAHVGVLRVLEQHGIRVDAVAGTSMGSVVGGLYASGLSVDSIASIIERANWDRLLADNAERDRRFLHQRRFDERAVLNLPVEGGIVSLAAGATHGSNVLRLAEVITWPVATVRSFTELRRPFVAVATDIETGEAVTLSRGVLSDGMRASIGIPGAFEPFELDGRLLVDGAVVRNLPAQDARALGVDFLICSDVSDPLVDREELGSIVEILGQVLSLSMQRSNAEQRELCDLVVRPDIRGLGSRAWERHDDWFERGEAATEEHADALGELARAQRRGPAPAPASAALLGDSVRVVSLQVEGSSRPETDRFVRQELGVVDGAFVSARRLSNRLSDLDATGLFGLVRYRLDRAPGGVALTVHVEEHPRDRFGVGLRYDDERRAALLFTTTLHNLVRHGSVTRLDLRVGEETRARIAYLRRHSVTGRLEGGTSLSWSQGTLRLADPGRLAAGIEITSFTSEFGIVPGRSTFVGVEAVGEWSTSDQAALPDVLLASASFVLDHESLDQIDFPTRGLDATVRVELGITDVTPGGSFRVATARGRSFFPLHPSWTLDLGAFVGRATGPDLPTYRTFFVGGAHPSAIFPNTQPLFHGVPSEELVGTGAQVYRAGLRARAPGGVYVRFGVDVGGASPEQFFPWEDAIIGWGLTVAVGTPVGPARLEWGQATDGFGDRLTVSVGRWF